MVCGSDVSPLLLRVGGPIHLTANLWSACLVKLPAVFALACEHLLRRQCLSFGLPSPINPCVLRAACPVSVSSNCGQGCVSTSCSPSRDSLLVCLLIVQVRHFMVNRLLSQQAWSIRRFIFLFFKSGKVDTP